MRRSKCYRYSIEAERFGRLEIDYQLEFRRLPDRQIGGRGPAEDFVDVTRGLPVEIVQIRPVAHQQTRLRELPRICHCRQAMLRIALEQAAAELERDGDTRISGGTR